jgi:hypothetical protein
MQYPGLEWEWAAIESAKGQLVAGLNDAFRKGDADAQGDKRIALVRLGIRNRKRHGIQRVLHGRFSVGTG